MRITSAGPDDLAELARLDQHIAPALLAAKIERGEVLVARDGAIVGWLRFGYFWDNIPFMNMLVVVEARRGQGIGSELARHWEDLMARRGYDQVMTSTQADERGQFLYRKLGYVDCGALLLPGDPLEILFLKQLNR